MATPVKFSEEATYNAFRTTVELTDLLRFEQVSRGPETFRSEDGKFEVVVYADTRWISKAVVCGIYRRVEINGRIKYKDVFQGVIDNAKDIHTILRWVGFYEGLNPRIG